MPITDNSFTAPELSAAIQANPDLAKLVAGYATDENTPVYKEVEPVIASKVTSKQALQWEKDIKELTGIDKKDANERYIDYGKRAVGEALAEKATLKTELEKLKALGDPSSADKQHIKDLEKAIKEKTTELTNLQQTNAKVIRETTNQYELRTGLAKVSVDYKKDFAPDVIKVLEDNAIAQLKDKLRIQENGTVTIDKDDTGAPELDPITYLPITVEQKLKQILKPIIEEQKIQPGAGSQRKENPPAGSKIPAGSKFTGVPGTVKTRVELSEHLFKLGITSGEEFDTILEEFGKGLPLR